MVWFGPATRMAITALAAAFLFFAPSASVNGDDSAVAQAKSLSRAFRQAAEQATPSVVTLIARSKPPAAPDRADLRELLNDPRFDGLLPDAPGADEEPWFDEDEMVVQVGSGVVIEAGGVILTNNHVVQDAEEVTVRFPDGSETEAVDIKTDQLSDLAVVQVKAQKPLKAAKLGDSSSLNIGDWVIAIGSPFELEATVSAGIISGKGRGLEKIRRGKLLQTDAAINPGNSGGPLVNLDGEVVGLNTAIASSSGGYQGIGFAIPINRAKWVSSELLKFGQVRRAYLGIQIDELTPEAARELSLAPRSGAYVVNVFSNGPADKAGLKVNDVIVSFADEAVRSPRDLQDVVEQKPIDSQQSIRVMRAGKELSLRVKLTVLQ